MANRRRSSDGQAERTMKKKKKKRSTKILFLVLSQGCNHRFVYKLDLNNRHFYATDSSSFPNYASLQITEITWPYRKIISSRCSKLSKKKKKRLVPATFSIGKLNRHLRFQPRRDVPPLIPRYMELKFKGHGGGTLPINMAMASLGSKIYLIGGYQFPRNPRDVYVIDTLNSPPRIEKMSSQLNSGKCRPIAWTIHGKIYVMPDSFTAFECFDPDSNSWTILPDPPFVVEGGSYPSCPPFANGEMNIYGGNCRPTSFAEDSYAVVGTNLLISIAFRGVFAFDCWCTTAK